MLNVCFGASECGMIRIGLFPEKTTYIGFMLDLGRLAPDEFDMDQLNNIKLSFSNCNEKECIEIFDKYCDRLNEIIEITKKEKEIRIWYASSQRSMCGYYYLVSKIKDIDCKINVIEMPDNISYRGKNFDKSWGEAESKDIKPSLSLEKTLTREEINQIVLKWDKLVEENSELRLNINGEIKSVPIDYLDNEIISYFPKNKEVKLIRVIAKTMQKCKHALSDDFIARRIESLISKNVITVENEVKNKNQTLIYYNETILKYSL